MRKLYVTCLVACLLWSMSAFGLDAIPLEGAASGKAVSLAASGSPAWLGGKEQGVAGGEGEQTSTDKQNDNCWSHAARMYGVDAWLLYSIAEQESSHNPRALHRNTDGTYDIGEMQINSSLIPVIARYGIRAEDLWNECLNIHIGAWVLADSIRSNGLSWESVGAYNAGGRKTKHAELQRARYARSVYRIYSRHMRMFNHA